MRTLKILTIATMMAALPLSPLAYAEYNNNNNNTNTMNHGEMNNSSMAVHSDADIVSSIKSKVAADKLVSDLNVSVTSQDGVVTLNGTVDTDNEAGKLIEISESTPGVKDTNTAQLTVKESKQPFTDTVITAKVKGTYIREKLMGDMDVSVMSVSVETKNGVVHLSGTVETQAQANNAVKLAKSIDGVKSVDSKIEVKPAS